MVRELPEGPFLSQLRELCISNHGEPPEYVGGGYSWHRSPGLSWHLPSALAAATQLEDLNLGSCEDLQLDGRDEGLLRRLPRLHRLVLPWQRHDGGGWMQSPSAWRLDGVKVVYWDGEV